MKMRLEWYDDIVAGFEKEMKKKWVVFCEAAISDDVQVHF